MERDERSSFAWEAAGKPVTVSVRRLGQGPCLLLLPALSSIATLDEMAPLQERLADRFATVAVDWPGFGTRPRPPLPWTPELLDQFLSAVLTRLAPQPFATIAAGHAAGYLLRAAARRPGIAGRLVLVAPTWRGPLPTMMGARPTLSRRLAAIGDMPLLGQALYRLNVNRPMVRMMAREHVYADPHWLTPERLARKMDVPSAPGARHAAIRFVTGLLDPMPDRATFLETARRLRDPVLQVYGRGTPRRSLAEMEALAALPRIETAVLPAGKLAVHEEEPETVASAIRRFLEEAVSAA